MKCPFCKATVTAECVNDIEHTTPSPGDFAFCLSCRTLLVAIDSETFRKASKLDVDELGDDEREELHDAVGTVRFE